MKKYLFLIVGLFLSLNLLAQNLYLGTTLKKDRRYYSSNGQYSLVFQNDGNLVLYRGSNSPKWASNTENRGDRAEFQTDGNLVVYDYSGNPIFDTKTNNKGASRLHVDNNGKIVIFGRGNNTVWQSSYIGGNDSNNGNDGWNGNGGSWNNGNNNNWGGNGNSWSDNDKMYKGYKFVKNTKLHSPNREYHLVFQEDGNLVVYDRNKNVYWSTKTENRGARAEFQRDGNLVVYDYSGRPIYDTKTNGKGASVLRMQDDGNLVIYTSGNKPLWASQSQK